MISHKAALWAGIAAGPIAWAISTEFNYASAGWQCAHSTNVTLPVGAVLALAALGGAFISSRARRQENGNGHFLAVIGMGLGLLSAAIVLTQGAAGAVVNACVR